MSATTFWETPRLLERSQNDFFKAGWLTISMESIPRGSDPESSVSLKNEAVVLFSTDCRIIFASWTAKMSFRSSSMVSFPENRNFTNSRNGELLSKICRVDSIISSFNFCCESSCLSGVWAFIGFSRVSSIPRFAAFQRHNKIRRLPRSHFPFREIGIAISEVVHQCYFQLFFFRLHQTKFSEK